MGDPQPDGTRAHRRAGVACPAGVRGRGVRPVLRGRPHDALDVLECCRLRSPEAPGRVGARGDTVRSDHASGDPDPRRGAGTRGRSPIELESRRGNVLADIDSAGVDGHAGRVWNGATRIGADADADADAGSDARAIRAGASAALVPPQQW
jgi:hypothetical protein